MNGATFTVNVHNTGSSTLTDVQFQHPYYGSWSFTGQAVAPGQSVPWTSSDGMLAYADMGWRRYDTPGRPAVYISTGGANNGGTWDVYFDNSGSGSTNQPVVIVGTNCVTHVVWTNTGATWAQAMGVRVVNNQTAIDQNHMMIAVRPGGVVNYWTTNAGPCGTYIFGDTRDGATAPDFNSDETPYGITQPGGTGSSDDDNSDAPFVPDLGKNQGGSTNGLTSADYFKGVGAIVQAVAEVERSIRALGQVGTNRLTGGTNTTGGGFETGVKDAIVNADSAARAGMSNLLGKVDGLSTNNLAGTTNDAIFDLLNKMGLKGDEYHSNLLVSATNAGGTASNLIYSLRTNIESFDHSAAYDQVGAAVGSLLGVVPDAFGQVNFLGRTNLFDWKDVVNLNVVEWRMPGFKAWIRNFLLWMPLLMLIFAYVRDLPDAMHKVLSIPQAEVNATGAGAFSQIPGVSASARIVIVFAIVGAVMWLPSILTASVSTILTNANVDSVGAAAGAAKNILENRPDPMAWIITELNTWLPYIEWIVFALNYVAARMKVDVAISVLMAWAKAVGV